MTQELGNLLDAATENNEPDPNPLPIPLSWHILVRPMLVSQKTKSGLILSSGAQEQMQYMCNVGRVLSIGPEAFTNSEIWKSGKETPVKVGDYVVYGRHKGNKFNYKGVIICVLDDTDMIMKIEDPDYIDFKFGIAKQ